LLLAIAKSDMYGFFLKLVPILMVTHTTSAPLSIALPCMVTWTSFRYSKMFLKFFPRLTVLKFDLQLLINHNASLDTPVSLSFASTPLYTSAVHQHWQCFQALLRAGAIPKAKQPKSSLFHTVVTRNAPAEALELLRECGGNIFEKDAAGKYPHQVASINHTKLLQMYFGEYVDSRCLFYFNQVYFNPADTPRSLASMCRLCIRQLLGPKRLNARICLPLPLPLTKFVFMD
jgi:hypothetical protein